MAAYKFTKLLKDYTSQILLAVIICLVYLCMYYKNQCVKQEMFWGKVGKAISSTASKGYRKTKRAATKYVVNGYNDIKGCVTKGNTNDCLEAGLLTATPLMQIAVAGARGKL